MEPCQVETIMHSLTAGDREAQKSCVWGLRPPATKEQVTKVRSLGISEAKWKLTESSTLIMLRDNRL